MKLTWRAAPGETGITPVILADDSLPRGPGSMRVLTSLPGFRRLGQLAQYPGGDAVDSFDRKNLQTVYSAVVAYEFGTVNDCRRFMIRLGNRMHGKGTLQIDHDDFGSDVLVGIWESTDPIGQVGVACDIRYTFIGGAFSIVTQP